MKRWYYLNVALGLSLVLWVGCSKKGGTSPQGNSTPADPKASKDPGTTASATAKDGTKSAKPGDMGTNSDPGSMAPAPNILLLIADDLGVDVLRSSGLGKSPATTPTLDALAAKGLVFDNFWVTPACTTTRGALISGQHGFLSGIDFVPAVMPDTTKTIQKRLKDADIKTPYATGVFGKWHLAGPKGDANHPARFSVDRYAGNLFNLDGYNKWTLTQDGSQSESSEYHTSKVVDLALDFIRKQPKDKPWFAWVAFGAPHAPFHAPPEHLVSSPPQDNVPSKYRAMVEAMDSEIGRLLGALPEPTLKDTLVIFLGDNGTPRVPRDRDLFAQDHVKGSVYEGGIRAPLIVAGGPVGRPGQREAALVNATDLFATFVDLASSAAIPGDIPPHSVSFAALLQKKGEARRSFNYTEWKSNDELYWAVRDQDHKAILFPDGKTELYATSDISEVKPLDDTQTLNRLLDLGRKLRDGSLNPGKEPKPLHFCSMYAGSKMHQGRDISRDQSFAGQISIAVNGDVCEINTNGIPDHDFNDGKRAFPNPVSPQNFRLRIPLQPKANPQPTPLSLDIDNGVLLNGAKVDILAAACFGVGDGKVGCGDMKQPWRYDPMYRANGFNVDMKFAHTQASGAYHYHGVGSWADAAAVIGVAADGFAIHSARIELQGKNRIMRSSYRLKAGARVQSDPNAPFPEGQYDGTFRDDWEYVPGLGDLDECNGATVNGQYMYFATEQFPYFLGCFRGTPDPSFKKRGRAAFDHAHGHGHGPGKHQH